MPIKGFVSIAEQERLEALKLGRQSRKQEVVAANRWAEHALCAALHSTLQTFPRCAEERHHA